MNYQVKQYSDEQYKVYELTNGQSWIKVIPERGGIITGFGAQGEELLFLNKKTLYDESANIRGGNPILFPISGQLENGEYEWEGETYRMKNHGVARNHPWEVIETQASDQEASITIRLKSNQETKIEYPFDFEVLFTYRLTENQVTIDQEYTNQSSAPMPIYAGFHPYFKTSEKNLTYKSDATKYYDMNDGQIQEFTGSLDLSDKKEALFLLEANKKQIAFELPGLQKTVVMKYGQEFKYVVIWTEKGSDFICVEPWMARTYALNRKEELTLIQPGESLKTYMSIGVK